MARKSRKNLSVEPDVVTEPQLAIYNAGEYIRLSADDAKKRGDSLETQRDIIESFVATTPDIRIVEVYTDNKTTGTNFERPGFQRMLADVESGRINCIIVKDLSRFGRNAIDAGYYIEKYLPSLGVRFIAVTDMFDSNEGDGGIMLPLKNMISESYALDISRKCKSAQRQNIREGRFVGALAPYGYAKDSEDCGHLVIDPEAAVVVRKIFDWAAQGMGAGEITRNLNEDGILPPSHYKKAKGLINHEKLMGRPFWQKRVVMTMLGEKVYMGDMVQGKTKKVNNKEVRIHPSKWVCVENTHEPIICREQFYRVQKLMRQSSERDKAVRREAVPYSPHIFRGKVFCAHCGHPMHRRRQNKDGTYWYRCETQWRYKETACFQVSVKEAELKKAVMAILLKQTEAILGGAYRLEREVDGAAGGSDARLREISRGLQGGGRFMKSLYENMVGGLITTGEFVSMKADHLAKIEALSQEASEIRKHTHERKSVALGARDTAVATSEVIMGKELTAATVDRLVDKILVKRDKSFEICFCFKDEFAEEQTSSKARECPHFCGSESIIREMEVPGIG